ncbi:hypothetical protein SCH4B_0132 [Ruegeria sp. TrichCH4B]|nr:hypothetical protein SCH4B_0132 [Ruegeria sp. TrichCH4B]
MEDELIDPADDPVSELSPMPEGTEGMCPGPVVFPLADGADADNWADLFGYPSSNETGSISLGGLMQSQDPEMQFIFDVYDELVRQKGGDDSDAAMDWLTNFFPPRPEVGDRRTHHCVLVFESEGLEIIRGSGWFTDSPENTRLETPGLLDDAIYEIKVSMSLQVDVVARWGRHTREVKPIGDAAGTARAIIRFVDEAARHRQNRLASLFALNIVSVFMGVGIGAAALRVATTVGARLAASAVILFETSQGVEYVTGYMGGRRSGYNPLRETFRYLGRTGNGRSGEQTAEIVFNTLNIMIGFGGKVGLLAGGLYAGKSVIPTSCTPAEGDIDIIDAESIPLEAQSR